MGRWSILTPMIWTQTHSPTMTEHKIIAENDRGGKLTIVTSDRAKALRHAELFRTRGRFEEILIEVGGRIWLEPWLEEIP